MTRKCIMCKGKNYKNTCSFFSAPKDPGTRHLWQEAINIKDYIVNDDTYVCSRHFNKDDIITHWVSGVPPQVITIKYKKCRLRHGAVPIPVNKTINISSNISLNIYNNDITLNNEKYFIDSKKKEFDIKNKFKKSEQYLKGSLNCNLEDEIYEYIPEDFQELETIEKVKNLPENSKRKKLIENNKLDKKQIIYSTNDRKKILYINYANINDRTENILTYFPKKTYCKLNNNSKDETLQTALSKKKEQLISSPINWKIDTINKKIKMNETNRLDQLNKELKNNNFECPSNSFQGLIYKKILMLFEDFLELYNEVSLPNSWFASMISKEHNITIVYFCMNISNTGMPYVEKKVFLNNDMILRCGILNKEINQINFLKNGRSPNIYTLSDIEGFIEEFNQTSICTGVVGKDNLNKINTTLTIYNDEIRRHNECSLILNKGQSICFQCASLITHIKSGKYLM